ncbi:hypothetical protein Lepto7376_1796 [[Leptolyngbya] sp. PCC 7376]|uniref:CU044_2847 family protein n=1 Tax=[Leptolyngbya] sp. PCC 7376 TaxID=111781 RepID=UPI00029F2B02|nr:CU044_2847 family protein [[Leptolyngbya] sp. PCC 7376]AFY38124.1 hypothetical protein Lepto7376_1796 [[Leptolyngbya] sp. PCC 7376]
MSNLQRIELDDGTLIYIHAQPNPVIPAQAPTKDDKLDFLTEAPPENQDRIFGLERLDPKQQSEALKNTIQGYTKHVVQSFKELALAEVTEITLEFGVNIGAESGIPYIANGTAECNMNISVKCEFNKD